MYRGSARPGLKVELCATCVDKLRLLKLGECLECREEEQVAVVGSDVIALFPSLQERNTGKIIAEEVRVSEMKLDGLNYQQISLYVRMNRDLTGDLRNL